MLKDGCLHIGELTIVGVSVKSAPAGGSRRVRFKALGGESGGPRLARPQDFRYLTSATIPNDPSAADLRRTAAQVRV